MAEGKIWTIPLQSVDWNDFLLVNEIVWIPSKRLAKWQTLAKVVHIDCSLRIDGTDQLIFRPYCMEPLSQQTELLIMWSVFRCVNCIDRPSWIDWKRTDFPRLLHTYNTSRSSLRHFAEQATTEYFDRCRSTRKSTCKSGRRSHKRKHKNLWSRPGSHVLFLVLINAYACAARVSRSGEGKFRREPFPFEEKCTRNIQIRKQL